MDSIYNIVENNRIEDLTFLSRWDWSLPDNAIMTRLEWNRTLMTNINYIFNSIYNRYNNEFRTSSIIVNPAVFHEVISGLECFHNTNLSNIERINNYLIYTGYLSDRYKVYESYYKPFLENPNLIILYIEDRFGIIQASTSGIIIDNSPVEPLISKNYLKKHKKFKI
jgi:hypothetical protein